MGLFSNALNIFRVLGDLSHITSKFILIWAIHTNKSAEGVSLITQAFYVLVFVSRYMDLFWTPVFVSDTHPYADRRFLLVYMFIIKVFYIVSSLYIVFLMLRVYARTTEREKAWRLGCYCLGFSALLATPLAGIFKSFPLDSPYRFNFTQIVWTFSIVLESICVIPQLLLLRQTTVPTVIDSYYLFALGSYRAWYILNWIVRLADESHHFDPISVLFGILQTALYIDFFYVYYTRQRVKLRNGGIVDSDDIRQGLLVRRFMSKTKGRQSFDEEDGEDSENNRSNGGRWGPRGISVSADNGVHDIPGDGHTGSQRLTDPGAFEDDEIDEDPDFGPKVHDDHAGTANNGTVWKQSDIDK